MISERHLVEHDSGVKVKGDWWCPSKRLVSSYLLELSEDLVNGSRGKSE